MTTPREELQEAVTKALALLHQKQQEETKATEARGRYNTLLAQSADVEALEAQVAKEVAGKTQEMDGLLADTLGKLRQPLEAAQRAYDEQANIAAKEKDEALAQFTSELQEQLAVVKRSRLARLAELEMEVHAAKERVTTAQNSFNRLCENFKAQRGPDLKALIDALKP